MPDAMWVDYVAGWQEGQLTAIAAGRWGAPHARFHCFAGRIAHLIATPNRLHDHFAAHSQRIGTTDLGPIVEKLREPPGLVLATPSPNRSNARRRTQSKSEPPRTRDLTAGN